MMEFKEDRVVISGFCNYKGIKIFLFLNVIKIRDTLRDLEKNLHCHVVQKLEKMQKSNSVHEFFSLS